MFRSAVFKLTAFYFALILFVCVIFSIQAFVVASERITQGAQKQENIFRELGSFPPAPLNGRPDRRDEIRKQLDEQVERDRQQLLTAILLTDIAILAVGTILCYYFAKKTLRPIEHAHKQQSRFTADASHELRTPLAVMKTEIEVALRQNLSNPQLKEVLESNLEEIEKLSELSDQLLSLTSVHSDNPRHILNLSELVMSEISSLEKNHSITIDSTIQDNVSIAGIESLMRNLIDILVSNARQYSGDSPPKISVKLSILDGHKVELVVRDEGIGIAEDDIEHIFERFFRGTVASKNRKNGHGLGLSLVAEIILKHDAEIFVDSTLGEYTQFTVIFPKSNI